MQSGHDIQKQKNENKTSSTLKKKASERNKISLTCKHITAVLFCLTIYKFDQLY